MKLLLGDCLDKLKELDDNSIDSIVTDPPYGLSFMGKKWDYDVPSQQIWKECMRVLKPGGHLLAFAGSRTYHRMAVRIEDAGFEIRDQIMWIYGSGFPKSHNIGKAVDEKLGNTREIIGEKHRGDVQKAKQNGSGYLADPANRNNTKQFGYGTEIITKGNTEWEGWGTALKPAHEPIVMARKPFSGTVADNVLEWRTGGINIDGCRIDGKPRTSHKDGNKNGNYQNEKKYGQLVDGAAFDGAEGRFPANIIFDEEAGKMLPDAGQGGYGEETTSSASRFFYCPKTSKSDRSEGNNHPTVKPTDLMAYLIRLVTPKGGVVLDPFMGSGSTGKAAVREGMEFIGIEREDEYFQIAESRINYEINKPTKITKSKEEVSKESGK
jgi:DNA modification methylase